MESFPHTYSWLLEVHLAPPSTWLTNWIRHRTTITGIEGSVHNHNISFKHNNTLLRITFSIDYTVHRPWTVDFNCNFEANASHNKLFSNGKVDIFTTRSLGIGHCFKSFTASLIRQLGTSSRFFRRGDPIGAPTTKERYHWSVVEAPFPPFWLWTWVDLPKATLYVVYIII